MTSFDKFGKALFAFTPTSRLYGVFTNDDLFKSSGLKMPETFPQLLDVCRKAKAAGTVAIDAPRRQRDRRHVPPHRAWRCRTCTRRTRSSSRSRRRGKATFAGNAGWRRALQEFIDMNAAGCFQPGAAGTSGAAAAAQFAQGQGLMFPAITNMKGLDRRRATRQFTVSHHLFPGGTERERDAHVPAPQPARRP